MVWGAISFDSLTPLMVLRGILTAQRYVDYILKTVLLPLFLQYLDLIFQQDNARPHMVRVAMNCLTACQTLPWPARSEDVSLTDHAWHMMGRQLHLPRNVDDLVRNLDQIWQEVPQETIRELYHSMPLRVPACIQVGQHVIELVNLQLCNSEINHSIFLKL
ncbi:transposable element Tc1 transposase [Trichonephila clavipes]|nr:transposable element Tc1 transposase [Trichonephila clavipes]